MDPTIFEMQMKKKNEFLTKYIFQMRINILHLLFYIFFFIFWCGEGNGLCFVSFLYYLSKFFEANYLVF